MQFVPSIFAILTSLFKFLPLAYLVNAIFFPEGDILNSSVGNGIVSLSNIDFTLIILPSIFTKYILSSVFSSVFPSFDCIIVKFGSMLFYIKQFL